MCLHKGILCKFLVTTITGIINRGIGYHLESERSMGNISVLPLRRRQHGGKTLPHIWKVKVSMHVIVYKDGACVTFGVSEQRCLLASITVLWLCFKQH